MPNERKLTKSELKKREDIVMDMKKNKRELTKRYGKDAEAVMYGRATRLAKQKSESMNPDKIREMIKSSLKNPKKADLNKDGKLSSYEEKRGAAIEKSMKEMEMNDPILMKMRAAAAKDEKPDFGKEYGEAVQKAYNSSNLAKLNFLRKERSQLMSDMEQEAEPEGGPIADEYGAKLNRIDKAIAKLSGRKEMTYDQAIAEATRQDLGMSSSISKRRAKSALMNPSNDGSKVYGLDKDGKRVELKSVDDLDKFMKFELDADLNEDIDLGHQDNEPGMIKAQLYHIGSYAMELYKMMDGLEDMGEVDFPSWWQSKITTAENMIAGAKHYLEFELKEPAIDAFVSMSDELEEELYTPNEMGDMAIEKESASGAFESISEVEDDMNKKAEELIKDTLSKEGGAAGLKPLIKAVKGLGLNKDEVVALLKKMGKVKLHKDGDYILFPVEENLDLEAKVDALQRLKRGEIDTLPSDEDAKAALVKRVLGKLSKDKKKDKKQLDEYTDNSFTGEELISNTIVPGRDELATFDYFFPDGVASRSNAIASLQAHDNSGIKARMGRYAPMFVHVQYHDFEDEAAEKYRVHQTQYYNSNFEDKDPNFNPRVTRLSLTKLDPSGDRDKQVDMGSILVKTDDYIKDLNNLNITDRQS